MDKELQRHQSEDKSNGASKKTMHRKRIRSSDMKNRKKLKFERRRRKPPPKPKRKDSPDRTGMYAEFVKFSRRIYDQPANRASLDSLKKLVEFSKLAKDLPTEFDNVSTLIFDSLKNSSLVDFDNCINILQCSISLNQSRFIDFALMKSNEILQTNGTKLRFNVIIKFAHAFKTLKLTYTNSEKLLSSLYQVVYELKSSMKLTKILVLLDRFETDFNYPCSELKEFILGNRITAEDFKDLDSKSLPLVLLHFVTSPKLTEEHLNWIILYFWRLKRAWMQVPYRTLGLLAQLAQAYKNREELTFQNKIKNFFHVFAKEFVKKPILGEHIKKSSGRSNSFQKSHLANLHVNDQVKLLGIFMTVFDFLDPTVRASEKYLLDAFFEQFFINQRLHRSNEVLLTPVKMTVKDFFMQLNYFEKKVKDAEPNLSKEVKDAELNYLSKKVKEAELNYLSKEVKDSEVNDSKEVKDVELNVGKEVFSITQECKYMRQSNEEVILAKNLENKVVVKQTNSTSEQSPRVGEEIIAVSYVSKENDSVVWSFEEDEIVQLRPSDTIEFLFLRSQ